MQNEVYRSSNLEDKRTAEASQVIDSRAAVVEGQRRFERRTKASAPLLPTSPSKAAALMGMLEQDAGVSVETQLQRLLRAFAAAGEVTCLEAQRLLDIRHPPARVLNLRHAGYEIGTRWVVQTTERGHAHRTMAYTLLAAPKAGEVR